MIGFAVSSFAISGHAMLVIPPTVPGLEYTLPDNRLHYTLPANKIHFTMPENRLHFTLPDED